MNRPFTELATALQQAGFETRRALISEGVPAEQLLVYLGKDDSQNHFFLQLLFIGDLQAFAPAGEEHGFPLENDYLQFYCELPFKPLASTFPDLARLVLRANLLLPAGGFGLNEATPAIYCRQVLPCPGGRVDGQAASITVQGMAAAIEKYVPDLLAVASGEKTLADLG